MSQIDLFDPQIKLNQEALNQKFIEESISFRNENLEDQEPLEMNSGNSKQKMKSQRYKQGYKTINEASKTIKQSYLKKFLFNQSYVKQIAQNLIKKSYILQDKFINHPLLREEYLSNYSQKNQGRNNIQNIFPLINLNNKIMQIWDILKLIIYFYFMWMMPFQGVFLSPQDPQSHQLILYFIMILDIVLQLNKEIIVEGLVISDRRLIFKQFIKNDCIFQLIYMVCYSCITYQFLDQQITQIMNIGFFFFNLRKFQKCIQNYQESSIIINDKINLIELIITVLMLAHFMACIWYYVGTISQSYYAESWILKLNLQNETVLTQYCYSFYWAATTMVTVGYGDITGQNLYEIICSTILLFFSSGIFAFSMNSIGMILNNINQNGLQYRRNLLLINQYMTQNEVSNDLQVKVRNYLQFYYQSSSSNQQKDVNTIIDHLSQSLKMELVNDVRFKVIQNNSFLSNNFSHSAKQQIIQKCKSINYTPLEQVYLQESIDDCSLYIISKGGVNLIDKNSGRIIQNLKEGDGFGELEFLTEQTRFLSAYSSGFSQILKICRNDFIEIIKQNQQDFQQFHMLKDQILFNLKPIDKCEVCLESHIIFQCNKIFYKPNIESIIKRDLFNTYQDRYKFDRSRQKNVFQLQDNQIIKVRCQAYRYDNDILYQSKENISNKSKDTILNTNSDSSDSERQTNRMNQSNNVNKTSISQFKNFSNKRISQDRMNQESKRCSEIATKQKKRQSQYQPNSNEQIITQRAKKKSKFQNTLIVKQPSGVDNRINENHRLFEIGLDQQNTYQYYFPISNVKNVLRQLDKFRKDNQNEIFTYLPSNYMFFKLKRQKKMDE